MSQRIEPLSPGNFPAKSQATMDKLIDKMGEAKNIYATMAHAPAALNALTAMGSELGKGVIDAKLGEKIALAVAQYNQCRYCMAAHTAIAQKLGMSENDVAKARHFDADSAREKAMLKFAKALCETNGGVSNQDFEQAKRHLSEEEIIETVGVVVKNIFTNYINKSLDMEPDFPEVDMAPPKAA